MSKISSLKLVLAILFIASVASIASAQRRGRGSVQETTTVTVVEVPITISNKGGPIRGLTKENFEIFDGKKKQEIIGFEVVDLGAAGNEDVEINVPVAARRHFLAFFDLSFSDPNSIKKAQRAAADLVLSHLHPSDLAAVATYSKSKGPQLILPFTTDRSQVRYAIETLGMVSSERTQRDPLGLLVKEIANSGPDASADEGGPAGGGFADELQAQLSELATLRGRADKAEQVSVLAESMDGLAAMGQILGAVEGRKHVLYLSEGFDGNILFGTDDQATLERLNRQVAAGQTQNVDNDDRYGNSDARRVVDRTLEVMRRANASLQAIDIGGLVAGGKNRNLESLSYMARETDGEMFANFNNLGEAMGQLLEKTSVTYLLSFSPKNLVVDGEFHSLKVKTKGVPRGADVSHRPGYYAPKPYSQKSGFERQLQLAQDLIAGQRGSGSLGVNVVAAGFPVAGQNSYVPVLVELTGADLVRDHSEDVVPVEIFAYALDNKGTVRGHFARQLAINRQEAGAVFSNVGLKYWGHFDVPPGEYTVRVVARNPATGASGVDVDTMVVPGGASSAPTVAALFPEDPGKWVFLREEEGARRAGVEYPFLADNQAFIPASLPELKGAGAVHLVVSALGSGSLSAESQVLTPDGKPVEGGKLELAKDASASDGTEIVAADFNTKGLSAGEYLLVVTLKNLATGKDARTSLPIRVL